MDVRWGKRSSTCRIDRNQSRLEAVSCQIDASDRHKDYPGERQLPHVPGLGPVDYLEAGDHAGRN